MKREEFEQLVVSTIEEDISPEDSRRLEEWIRDHSEDREILEEMKKVHSLVGQLKKRSVPDVPLHAPDIVLLSRHRKRWTRWTLSAAAGFLLFLAASMQGVLIQVGTIRVAFGPVTNEQPDREFHKFLVQGERLSKRQDDLESSMQKLVLLQKESTLQNQSEMERFTSELIRELNRYFNDTRSIAYWKPEKSATSDK